MKFSPEIIAELSNISPLLAGIEKKNTFSVPEGYFNTLTIDVLKKINNQSVSDKLAVPEGYFNNLSDEILNKIKLSEMSAAEELRSLSPMMYSIQNENVFEVPAGYFKNLSDNILENVITRPETKVIQLKRRNSVWQYAVAAAVTGIIAVSSIMFFNRSEQLTADNNEIPVSVYIKEASNFKNEQQIDAGIASLSDDEIIKYLEKMGNDSDNEVLTGSINEEALPDQADYLLNEQTLDTYLSNIENKKLNN